MKISLVTASYNSASTIADTLDSVAAQSHPDIEHIIVDGGSTDATLEVVRLHDRRAARIVSEPDRGIYDAMNKGLRLASGDVVGLINSDDFLASPGALATVAAAFSDPAIDAVYGDLCYVSQADTSRVVRYWRSGPFEPGAFGRGWAPPHPTFYVRRDVYARHGGFNLAYPLAADLELMARFLELHRIRAVHVPEVLVRMRTGGATNRSLANIVRQNGEIIRALRKHGLASSLTGFALRKLVARLRQFTSRPVA